MPATDDVAGVYAIGRTLRVGDGEGHATEPELDLTVAGVRPFKGGLIARFEELADRNAAEAVRGRTLLMPAEDVRPLEPDEYFLHDLVGLEVRTPAGVRLGKVTELYERGPGYLLAIDDGERELLIPFGSQMVREVDLEAGVITIDPIPGLLDL
jgi:16S rRNA processing protein RimM